MPPPSVLSVGPLYPVFRPFVELGNGPAALRSRFEGVRLAPTTAFLGLFTAFLGLFTTTAPFSPSFLGPFHRRASGISLPSLDLFTAFPQPFLSLSTAFHQPFTAFITRSDGVKPVMSNDEH